MAQSTFSFPRPSQFMCAAFFHVGDFMHGLSCNDLWILRSMVSFPQSKQCWTLPPGPWCGYCRRLGPLRAPPPSASPTDVRGPGASAILSHRGGGWLAPSTLTRIHPPHVPPSACHACTHPYPTTQSPKTNCHPPNRQTARPHTHARTHTPPSHMFVHVDPH